MTDEEFLAEVAKGNFKRIGVIDGADQHGTELRVLCDEWQPMVADMFSVRGLIVAAWPNGRELDGHFTAVRILGEEGRRRVLEIHPPIILEGPYKNALRAAPDGSALYQPSGELLKTIWDRWLETAA